MIRHQLSFGHFTLPDGAEYITNRFVAIRADRGRHRQPVGRAPRMAGEAAMTPDWTLGYECDEGTGETTGDVIAINIHGHDRHPDTVDLVLDELATDGYIDGGCWEVREDWLRTVPRSDGAVHVYGQPGRGARPVTVLERWSFWGWWCYRHPDEPGKVGLPATYFIDGVERLREFAANPPTLGGEARPCADPRGYLYACRDCADGISRLRDEAYRKALAELKAEEAVRC